MCTNRDARSGNLGMRMNEERKLDLMEMKYLRNVYGVTRKGGCRKEDLKRRGGVREKSSKRVDQKVLKMFGERLTKRVYESDMEGKREKGSLSTR